MRSARSVEFDQQAKVVMCSALASRRSSRKPITAGARDFLIKPFNARAVVEVIAKVFNQVPTA